jgi:hypothetical protein
LAELERFLKEETTTNLNEPAEKERLISKAAATLELSTEKANSAGPKMQTEKLWGLSPRQNAKRDARLEEAKGATRSPGRDWATAQTLEGFQTRLSYRRS